MAENKTRQNDQSVIAFLEKIENESRRKDGFALLELMKEATGAEARMWGESIIGFGSYHYKYESGREGDSMVVGFSPRKQNLALYGLGGDVLDEKLLNKLGKYKTGKSCLYLNKLADADPQVLRDMVKQAYHRESEK
jgi:hypothetical protein